MRSSGPYVLLVIFAFLVMGGFYFLMSDVANVKSSLKNLEFAFNEFKNREPATTTETVSEEPRTITRVASTTPPKTDVTIPTGIIFTETSSPLLEPQTNITVTVEGVTRELDGTLTVNIKTYTNEAISFSALDVNQLFFVIDAQGNSQKPLFVNGSFSSIPAKSVTAGGLVFKVDPTRATVILQIGKTDKARYFELNFNTKAYEETPLG